MSDAKPCNLCGSYPPGHEDGCLMPELQRLREALAAAEAALAAEREAHAATKAQVKRWEDKEVQRASCCDDNERRAEAAESRLREARVIIEEDTRWSCCGAWIAGSGEHMPNCRLAAFLARGEG